MYQGVVSLQGLLKTYHRLAPTNSIRLRLFPAYLLPLLILMVIGRHARTIPGIVRISDEFLSKYHLTLTIFMSYPTDLDAEVDKWTRMGKRSKQVSKETESGSRNRMLNALKGFSTSKQNGLFVNSCFAHCETERQYTWFADDSPVINKECDGAVDEHVGSYNLEL